MATLNQIKNDLKHGHAIPQMTIWELVEEVERLRHGTVRDMDPCLKGEDVVEWNGNGHLEEEVKALVEKYLDSGVAPIVIWTIILRLADVQYEGAKLHARSKV